MKPWPEALQYLRIPNSTLEAPPSLWTPGCQGSTVKLLALVARANRRGYCDRASRRELRNDCNDIRAGILLFETRGDAVKGHGSCPLEVQSHDSYRRPNFAVAWREELDSGWNSGTREIEIREGSRWPIPAGSSVGLVVVQAHLTGRKGTVHISINRDRGPVEVHRIGAPSSRRRHRVCLAWDEYIVHLVYPALTFCGKVQGSPMLSAALTRPVIVTTNHQ